MSASNCRVKEYQTVHHITSRIAHRVYFLGEDERNDLIDMVRRSACFSGIRLLAWCVMTNHFHLLVYLPVRAEVDDDEVLARIAVLKGEGGRRAAQAQIDNWIQQGNQAAAKAWFDRQRQRMYDVGEFMKLVKQWFSQEYNRRQAHCGTLWESVYFDRVVEYKTSEIAKCAAYIHLNPIRAAACAGYADYPWSSFSALAKGDPVALEGVRFIYDDPMASREDLMSRHGELMDALLENVKRERAEAIARKRTAGFDEPVDHLTTEAMVAQSAAHLQKVQEALASLRFARKGADAVLSALTVNPSANPESLAELLSLAPSTIYEHLRYLRMKGKIFRNKRSGPWSINP